MEDKTKLKTDIATAGNNGSLLEAIAGFEFETLGEVGLMLAELHNEAATNALDFFESVKWLELSTRDQMRVASVLESCIGDVQEDPQTVFSFFHDVATTIHQHNAYHLQNAFGTWASKNGDKLQTISNLISESKAESPYLTALLHAWRACAPSDALVAALEYTSDARDGIKKDAIFALGSFKYRDNDEAVPAIEKLSDLLQSSARDERLTAIAAGARLLDKNDDPVVEIVEQLHALTVTPDPDTRHALIAGHVHNKDAYPDALKKPVFDLMKTVTSDCMGTLDLADMALYQLDLDSERETVFEVLTAALTQDANAPDLPIFDSLTHKLETAHHEVLFWFTTRWLLDGEYVICRELNALFPPLNKNPYDVDLKPFDLKPAEVFYLARKAYVYLMFCHGAGVSLLSACLMQLKLPHRKQLEADICGFWLRNFPGDIDIFDAVAISFPRKGLKASIKRLRAHIADYETPLRGLSNNPALKPSSIERRVQAELAHERNREVGRMAQEKSILGSLVHTSTLLYGRASVTYVYPGDGREPIRQIIPMTSFQTSSALPRMDSLYPARLNFLLHRFRNERRPT